MTFNQQILLKSRPVGMPKVDDFAMHTAPIPKPGDGEVLAKNLFLSVDPYMRSRMNEGRSYLPPIALNGMIGSSNIGRVISSQNASFKPGDLVYGYSGWEEYSVYGGPALRTINSEFAAPEAFLGVLGMPGCTAYIGVLDYGLVKEGETFVVSAASGPVGSVAGQIAKIKGARVVGIAGGPEKCRYVVEEFKFDACVDHRSVNFPDLLADACPDGIDVDFENVGGGVLETIWPLLNDFARIPLCGLIAGYNDNEPKPGPDLRNVLTRRLSLMGFNFVDHRGRMPDFLHDVSRWVREGHIKHREHIIKGLENTPQAFIDLLSGRNFGKVVVHLSD